MRFAICNETYVEWSFERVCADAAECGYDGVEVALMAIEEEPGTIDEPRATELGRIAEAVGLAVVGLHWLLARTSGGLHLTTPDDVMRRRTVDYLIHLARVCAAMGGRILVLGSPQQRNVLDGVSYEDAFARATDACRRVSEVAEPLGVTLALEPLAPAYTNFLTSADEAARLIEAVDHPACRLHLDVFAMQSEVDAIPDIIRRHAATLAHFHANDSNMLGPGSGDVDYPPIARALDEIGYGGWVSVEVFDYAPGGPTIARDSLAFLRRLWN